MESISRGFKFILKPNETRLRQALMADPDTDLNEQSAFSKVSLWVFSRDGKLILEKEYNVK